MQFFSENPSVFAAQIFMVFFAFIVVFLVLLATRDIMLRTESLLLQVLCIVLVAGLPVVGYLLYLLVRPSRTLSEKRLQHDMDSLLKKLSHSHSQVQKKPLVQEKSKK